MTSLKVGRRAKTVGRKVKKRKEMLWLRDGVAPDASLPDWYEWKKVMV